MQKSKVLLNKIILFLIEKNFKFCAMKECLLLFFQLFIPVFLISGCYFKVSVKPASPLDSTSNAPPAPTVPITIAFNSNVQSLHEASGTATATVTLSSAADEDILIPYTIAGTASEGSDYTGLSNGTLTIPSGQTSGTLMFSIIYDAISEASETVIITLGTPSGNTTLGTPITQTITIANLNLRVGAQSLPMALDPATALNLTITSMADATHYKYKIGQLGVVDCTATSGYSSSTPLATLITESLASYTDGTSIKLCLIGANNAGAQEPLTSHFSYSWIKDTATQINITTLGQSYDDSNLGPLSLDFSLSQIRPYDVTVGFTVSGTSGSSDHSLATGSVLIPAGQTTANVSYNILRNLAVNTEKSVNIRINQNAQPGIIFGTMPYQFNSIKDADSGTYTTMTKISAGYGYTCGINSNGVLKCWGLNTSGRLGDSTDTQRFTPVIIDSGTNYSLITTGNFHSCGITTTGVLKCWGLNSNGRLGDGTTTARFSPTIINTGTNYSQISAGFGHTCGITTTGVLKCWGLNTNGRLGDGTTNQRTSPTDIDSGTAYSQISAGYSHTCGITTTGVLKCWGNNAEGQLGNNSTTEQTSPIVINGGTTYSQVSAGETHSCGITTTGVLKCWGLNTDGQLGDGTTAQRLTPKIIDTGVNYSKIVTGKASTCGITTTGILKCWGENGNGALGDGTWTRRTSPTVINSGTNYLEISLSGNNTHTCGIISSGALKCWGENGNGQFGNGETVLHPTPMVIHSGTNYGNIDAGNYHTCGITTAGALYCWGAGASGKLGDGVASVLRATPTSIDTLTFYSQISAGTSHSCGITTTGVLKCWGSNTNGRLGDGTTTSRPSPTVIDSGTSYSKVATGDTSTCGITTVGILKCWGNNGDGQLGDGSTTTRTSPTIIDSGTSYSHISVGEVHSCAITTAGVLKCWGNNEDGQLGDGTITARLTPTIIDSGINYSQIAAGEFHTCGITEAGVLNCWGLNIDGQLGDGTTTDRWVPTLIDSGVSYSRINLGDIHSCGIAAGAVKCWGSNNNGQVGNNTVTAQLTPTIINAGTNYTQVVLGAVHTCGITTLGALHCWGKNGDGQVGLDSDILSNTQYPQLILHINEP